MYPSFRILPWPREVTLPHLTLVRESAPRYGRTDPSPVDPTGGPSADELLDVTGTSSDELLELGDRIAELARSIQVAEAEMMRLIVEFDERRGWKTAGFPNCAEWLAWRIGVRSGAARERVRTARALGGLPQTLAAMTAGELSYAKARALTRVATPDSEGRLLELAAAGSAENLERVVRAWKAMDDVRELTVEQARHRRRAFSVFVDDDGSYIVKGRLDPEVGAVLMRAVEAASDALFRAENGAGESGIEGREDQAGGHEVTPAQRRADAVGLLAERALASGFGDDARGTRADRYQVLLRVEPDTLRSDRPSGRAELDGVRVPKATARRLTCDTGVSLVAGGSTHVPAGTLGHRVMARTSVGRVSAETPTCCSGGGRSSARGAGRHDGPSSAREAGRQEGPSSAAPAVAGAGRRTRTIPPAVRRALLARDKGCRFPGCGSRFCEAHHIVHWADGGPTDLDNLVLLCRRHHRFVHEEGMTICMDRTGAVVFFTAGGRAIAGAPAPRGEFGMARPGNPRTAVARAGAPHPLPSAPVSHATYPGAARFVHDRDIPWRIEARAWEALDAPGDPT